MKNVFIHFGIFDGGLFNARQNLYCAVKKITSLLCYINCILALNLDFFNVKNMIYPYETSSF
jgi:hypothetical protein